MKHDYFPADIERYNRLRNAWVKKYGTFRNFDRWYGLNREIERLRLIASRSTPCSG